MTVGIRNWSHVGVRVRERARSVAFYRALGFEEALWFEAAKVAILRHPAGLEINLIVNADDDPTTPNLLMDVPEKHPGYTHAAFVVESLDAAMASLASAGIQLSDGPVKLGGVAMAVFVRDPDGNVIEFDELIAEQ